ncbi:hypothetical protein GSI_12230 [Ganoderma sinense ZZ0214-1]|uniref:RlpA-like protein double-psi beta-barrel domain-containing protein n=1 Tax=Ganoderma sinense ZZ0214-1 TaxID=1077348 RepID=A0A2G8RY84_9APHY|nr:hypothetical protein GSI_12230 [Ganoderma sinense ZZ0214-1]
MRFSTIVLAILSAAATGFAQEMALTGGDATYYNTGLGSCGVFNTDADFIVAVDIHTIQSFPGAGTNPNLNPMCGRQMKVTAANGKSVTVTVEDTCPTCAVGSVDLSPVAFQQLADLAVGRLHNVSWTLL